MDYEQTAYDLFYQTAEKYPNKTALNFLGKKITYDELRQLAGEFSIFLLRKSIRHGDRVSILLPNCPQFVIAYLGILKIGAVVAAMNPLVSTEEIRLMVKQADPKLLITAENFSNHNKALYQDLNGVTPMMMVKLNDCMPWLISVLYRLKNIKQKFFTPANALNWASETTTPSNVLNSFERRGELVVTGERLRANPNPFPKPDDLAILQFSGGTTGLPKAAMLTHRNVVSNALQAFNFVNKDETVIDENSIFLGVLPFFHVYGLSVCLNIAFKVGTAVVLLPRFDAGMVFKAIAKNKVDIFPGINRMFASLVEVADANPSKHKKMCQSLRLCFNGAGPLNSEVKKQFESLSDSTIIEGYGLAEASPIVSINPVKGGKAGSMGQLVTDTEMKLVEGELWVRGPQVMVGYWQNEKETSETLKEGGWLATGDMARVDEDGFLWFEDRKKDMIKVRGENVFTKEIEDVLKTHPAIADTAVLGMPDKMLGERIVACVVLKEGQTLDQPSLEAFCRKKKLASVKIPQEVAVVKEIPRTIIGKTLKRELRKMLAEKK